MDLIWGNILFLFDTKMLWMIFIKVVKGKGITGAPLPLRVDRR